MVEKHLMPQNSSSPEPAPAQRRQTFPWRRLIVFTAILVAASLAYWLFRDQLDLTKLAEREAQLRAFQKSHPLPVLAGAFLFYVAMIALNVPAGAVLTLSYAWLFGFLPTLVLVSFASTAGATLSFLLARYLLHDAIQQRFGDRLAKVHEALRREGAFYLFMLRLIPLVPFFVINPVMGLTPMRARTFWWVSQLGMLPGTAVYVWAGSSVPSLKQLSQGQILKPEMLAAFVALGLFPLVVRKLFSWLRPQGPPPAA